MRKAICASLATRKEEMKRSHQQVLGGCLVSRICCCFCCCCVVAAVMVVADHTNIDTDGNSEDDVVTITSVNVARDRFGANFQKAAKQQQQKEENRGMNRNDRSPVADARAFAQQQAADRAERAAQQYQ